MFGFVVVMSDLVHNVEAIFPLPSLLTALEIFAEI